MEIARWLEKLFLQVSLYKQGIVMNSFFKRYWKILCLSAGVYLLWVLGWLIYTKTFCPSIMNHINGIQWKPSNFSISYAASALDSLIFFTVVGLAITVISIKRPEEEKLATKIEYIFPDADADSTLGRFLANKISSLACISPVTSRIITIKEISEENETVKVMSRTNCIIKNIHNNHHYATDSMSFGVKSDPVKVDGDLIGEVNDISIFSNLEDPSKNQHILSGAYPITTSSPEFSETFSLKLSPGEVVSYQTSAWLWQPIKESLRFTPPRYTESQDVTIHNETLYAIDFRVGIPNDADVSFQIQPGRSHNFKVGSCTPGEKIIVHFEKWKLHD